MWLQVKGHARYEAEGILKGTVHQKMKNIPLNSMKSEPDRDCVGSMQKNSSF